jgi:hypothetical protein
VLSGGGAEATDLPVLRRADAHPDAPPRRPLFATQDLGTPFLDVRAPVHVVADDTAEPVQFERDLPADLDTPLSAFDPQAIPDAPIAPMSLPRPQLFDERERFETFPLTPMVRPTSEQPAPIRGDVPRAVLDTSTSIHALLDRLEKGVTSRAPAPRAAREESLQESLASLRRLATNS